MRTTKWVFEVACRHVHYVRYTIESYDGMAVVKTLDPGPALIEITVAPGCEEIVVELLASLREHEGIVILEKEAPS